MTAANQASSLESVAREPGSDFPDGAWKVMGTLQNLLERRQEPEDVLLLNHERRNQLDHVNGMT